MKKEKLKEIIEILYKKNLKISSMESCTSGLLISTITDIEGASTITDGGYVTYSNKSKILNGVDKDIINNYGVYSIETSNAMAKSCKNKNNCDIGIGVTGTFSNLDKNNKDSECGIVYYTINYKEHIFQKKIQVPLKNFNLNNSKTLRYWQKEYVVNEILEQLYNILKE